MPANELGGTHTRLVDLWGGDVEVIRSRLAEAGTAEKCLDILEDVLVSRLAEAVGPHPVVAFTVQRLARGMPLRDLVEGSGYSHRHFIALFRQAVGMSPKKYGRLLRFQRALQSLATSSEVSLSEVALSTGYADQSHFTRDFKEFSGLAPAQYRSLRPKSPNHVPFLSVA